MARYRLGHLQFRSRNEVGTLSKPESRKKETEIL